MPCANWPNRCVSWCGAVDCFDESVRERAEAALRVEMVEVTRRRESQWASIATWKRGQSSMLVPLT